MVTYAPGTSGSPYSAPMPTTTPYVAPAPAPSKSSSSGGGSSGSSKGPTPIYAVNPANIPSQSQQIANMQAEAKRLGVTPTPAKTETKQVVVPPQPALAQKVQPQAQPGQFTPEFKQWLYQNYGLAPSSAAAVPQGYYDIYARTGEGSKQAQAAIAAVAPKIEGEFVINRPLPPAGVSIPMSEQGLKNRAQELKRESSDLTAINELFLKPQINIINAEAIILETEKTKLLAQQATLTPEEYNKRVNAYNLQVEAFRKQTGGTAQIIDAYNKDVTSYQTKAENWERGAINLGYVKTPEGQYLKVVQTTTTEPQKITGTEINLPGGVVLTVPPKDDSFKGRYEKIKTDIEPYTYGFVMPSFDEHGIKLSSPFYPVGEELNKFGDAIQARTKDISSYYYQKAGGNVLSIEYATGVSTDILGGTLAGIPSTPKTYAKLASSLIAYPATFGYGLALPPSNPEREKFLGQGVQFGVETVAKPETIALASIVGLTLIAPQTTGVTNKVATLLPQAITAGAWVVNPRETTAFLTPVVGGAFIKNQPLQYTDYQVTPTERYTGITSQLYPFEKPVVGVVSTADSVQPVFGNPTFHSTPYVYDFVGTPAETNIADVRSPTETRLQTKAMNDFFDRAGYPDLKSRLAITQEATRFVYSKELPFERGLDILRDSEKFSQLPPQAQQNVLDYLRSERNEIFYGSMNSAMRGALNREFGDVDLQIPQTILQTSNAPKVASGLEGAIIRGGGEARLVENTVNIKTDSGWVKMFDVHDIANPESGMNVGSGGYIGFGLEQKPSVQIPFEPRGVSAEASGVQGARLGSGISFLRNEYLNEQGGEFFLSGSAANVKRASDFISIVEKTGKVYGNAEYASFGKTFEPYLNVYERNYIARLNAAGPTPEPTKIFFSGGVSSQGAQVLLPSLTPSQFSSSVVTTITSPPSVKQSVKVNQQSSLPTTQSISFSIPRSLSISVPSSSKVSPSPPPPSISPSASYSRASVSVSPSPSVSRYSSPSLKVSSILSPPSPSPSLVSPSPSPFSLRSSPSPSPASPSPLQFSPRLLFPPLRLDTPPPGRGIIGRGFSRGKTGLRSFYADLASVARSQLLFGKGTSPSLLKRKGFGAKYEGRARVPTVELLSKKKPTNKSPLARLVAAKGAF